MASDEQKVKLPSDVSTMSDADLQRFIDAHLVGGHKRKLAEEVMRLRKELKKAHK